MWRRMTAAKTALVRPQLLVWAAAKKTDTEGTANLGYTAVMMPSAVKDARKTLSNIAAVQFLYCDDCVAATICT